MKWRNLLTGFAIGFAAAYVYQRNQSSLSSSEALHIVKQAFKKNGTIDGSWIDTTTKILRKHDMFFEGFNGGIIRTVDNEQEHFEFFIDQNSGAILELKKI
ncbi:peptidase [Bacillus songklensis]|uniref:Peptidase n=1 Tax=Bacillus songklensis TaxID=1069116 RepID=A0ABV8B051_9BACI